MAEALESLLRVAPFAVGTTTLKRAILRRLDAPHYVDLTLAELAAVQGLKEAPESASDFLGRHLGAKDTGLDFRQAVALIMKLNQARILADASDDMTARLAEFATKSEARGFGRIGRVARGALALLDLPLVSFPEATVHKGFRAIGRLLVSPAAVIAFAATLLALAVVTGVRLPTENVYVAHFAEPEVLIAKVFFAFSLALGWTAFWQMAALAGAGATFVGGSIRLTGLCIVRLAVEDRDALMLPKTRMLCYHGFTLLSPWVSALICFQLVKGGAFTSLAGLLAGTFTLLGLVMLCPLYRSPVVKIAESLLASLDVLERANAHLARGLFRFARTGQSADSENDAQGQLWITIFACVTIVWLYALSLNLYDALVGAVPDLWVQALHILKSPLRGVAAVLILAVLTAGALGSVLRLIMIPFQNLAAFAFLPITRARRGIDAFYNKSMEPSQAVANFLREIPVLADLNDAERLALAGALKYRRYGAGQTIIRKGEPGEEFFILADGRAQVVLGGQGEPETVVDMLSPGDSFGEIALVEHTVRTATIRATEPLRALILERQAFDRLFPEGGMGRSRLTHMIRQVKLVLESKALSHLTPRQVRGFLQHAKLLAFKPGQALIEEQAVGDQAFLIASGEVEVSKAGKKVANLGRGELVGAVALLKDVRRTASVRAVSEVSALAIDKATFLKMCMSNVFVALLVTDLADRQLAAAKKVS